MANMMTLGPAPIAQADATPPNQILDGFVTKSELATALGVSERTIDRWVNLRQFPKPAKIGRLILWRQEIVRRHLGQLADNDHSGAMLPSCKRRR